MGRGGTRRDQGELWSLGGLRAGFSRVLARRQAGQRLDEARLPEWLSEGWASESEAPIQGYRMGWEGAGRSGCGVPYVNEVRIERWVHFWFC